MMHKLLFAWALLAIAVQGIRIHSELSGEREQSELDGEESAGEVSPWRALLALLSAFNPSEASAFVPHGLAHHAQGMDEGFSRGAGPEMIEPGSEVRVLRRGSVWFEEVGTVASIAEGDDQYRVMVRFDQRTPSGSIQRFALDELVCVKIDKNRRAKLPKLPWRRPRAATGNDATGNEVRVLRRAATGNKEAKKSRGTLELILFGNEEATKRQRRLEVFALTGKEVLKSAPARAAPAEEASALNALPDGYVIFSAPWCMHCTMAKKLIESQGYTYVEKDTTDDKIKAEMYLHFPAAKTIPQIFLDNIHIGGFTDLQRTTIGSRQSRDNNNNEGPRGIIEGTFGPPNKE